MKRILIVCGLLGLSLVSASGVWAEVEVTMSVSDNNVEVGERVELEIVSRETGSANVRIGSIDVPGSEDFQVQGTSTSTQVRSINGESSAVTTIRYTLVPAQEGSFTLGPVVVDGGISNTVNIVVGEGTAAAPFIGRQEEQASPTPAPTLDEDETSSNPEPTMEMLVAEGGDVDNRMTDWWVLIGLGLMVVFGLLGIGKMLSKGTEHELQSEVVEGNKGDFYDEKRSDSKLATDINNEVDVSVDVIRTKVVEWLESHYNTSLSHMGTREIEQQVGASGKTKQALDVLKMSDEAKFGKKEVDTQTLLDELKKLLS